MAKTERELLALRFSDNLVLADKGEVLDILVHVDRKSSDYEHGANARKAGEPRDMTRNLNWLLGWDEAPDA